MAVSRAAEREEIIQALRARPEPHAHRLAAYLRDSKDIELINIKVGNAAAGTAATTPEMQAALDALLLKIAAADTGHLVSARINALGNLLVDSHNSDAAATAAHAAATAAYAARQPNPLPAYSPLPGAPARLFEIKLDDAKLEKNAVETAGQRVVNKTYYTDVLGDDKKGEMKVRSDRLQNAQTTQMTAQHDVEEHKRLSREFKEVGDKLNAAVSERMALNSQGLLTPNFYQQRQIRAADAKFTDLDRQYAALGARLRANTAHVSLLQLTPHPAARNANAAAALTARQAEINAEEKKLADALANAQGAIPTLTDDLKAVMDEKTRIENELKLKPEFKPVATNFFQYMNSRLVFNTTTAPTAVKLTCELDNVDHIHLFNHQETRTRLQERIFSLFWRTGATVSQAVKTALAQRPKALLENVSFNTGPNVLISEEKVFAKILSNRAQSPSPTMREYESILIASIINNLTAEDLGLVADPALNALAEKARIEGVLKAYKKNLRDRYAHRNAYGKTVYQVLGLVDPEAVAAVQAGPTVPHFVTPTALAHIVKADDSKTDGAMLNAIEAKSPGLGQVFNRPPLNALRIGPRTGVTVPGTGLTNFYRLVDELKGETKLSDIKQKFDTMHRNGELEPSHPQTIAAYTVALDDLARSIFAKNACVSKEAKLIEIVKLRFPSGTLPVEATVREKLKTFDTVTEIDGLITRLTTHKYTDPDALKDDLKKLGLPVPVSNDNLRLSLLAEIKLEMKDQLVAQLKTVDELPNTLSQRLVDYTQHKVSEFKDVFARDSSSSRENCDKDWNNRLSPLSDKIETRMKELSETRQALLTKKHMLADTQSIGTLNAVELAEYVNRTTTPQPLSAPEMKAIKEAYAKVTQKEDELKDIQREIDQANEIKQGDVAFITADLAALNAKKTSVQSELVTFQRDLDVAMDKIKDQYAVFKAISEEEIEISDALNKLKEQIEMLDKIKKNLNDIGQVYRDGKADELKGQIAITIPGAKILSDCKSHDMGDYDAEVKALAMEAPAGGAQQGPALVITAAPTAQDSVKIQTKDVKDSAKPIFTPLRIKADITPRVPAGHAATPISAETRAIAGAFPNGQGGNSHGLQVLHLHGAFDQAKVLMSLSEAKDAKIDAAFDKLATPTPAPAAPLNDEAKKANVKKFMDDFLRQHNPPTETALMKALKSNGVVDPDYVAEKMMLVYHHRYFTPSTERSHVFTQYNVLYLDYIKTNLDLAVKFSGSSSTKPLTIDGTDKEATKAAKILCYVLSKILGKEEYSFDATNMPVPNEANFLWGIIQYLLENKKVLGELGCQASKNVKTELAGTHWTPEQYVAKVKVKIAELKSNTSAAQLVAAIEPSVTTPRGP